MTFLTGSDASNPDFALPGDVAIGYLGGATPHVWTPAQWEEQIAEDLFAYWVPDPNISPVVQAKQCLAALKALNWPEETAIGLDAELLPNGDAIFVNTFCDITASEHYGNHIYGSIDQVFTWPPRSGYIVANPTGVPHMYEHPFVKGTQYAWGEKYNSNLFVPTMKFRRNPNVGSG